MAEKVKVYDAEGVERFVHPVDAREIVAAGGSLLPGQKDAKGEPLVIPEPKKKPKQEHPAEANKKAKAKE